MNLQTFLKDLGKLVNRAAVQVERDVSYSQLWSRVNSELASAYDGWVWVDDIYQSNDGNQYAIVVKDGKLWRHAIAMDGVDVTVGEAVEVEVQFTDVSRSMSVIRQADGTRKWVAIAASSTLNRVGEIDSRNLFDDFKARMDSGEAEKPYLTVVHTGKALRIGDVTDVFRDGDIYINVGTFDEKGDNGELATAFADAVERDDEGTWGISIGFIPKKREILTINGDFDIPVYIEGEHVESSILLEADAASNLTVIGVERNFSMSKALEDALKKALGSEEAAEAWSEKADDGNRAIKRAGMITRDTPTPPKPPTPPVPDDEDDDDGDEPEVVDAEEGEIAIELTEEVEQAITARVTQNLLRSMEVQQKEIDTLKTRVTDLEAQLETERKARELAEKRLAEVERSEEEKQQEFLINLPRKTRAAPKTVIVRPRAVTPSVDGPLQLDVEADAMLDTILGQ